MLNSKENAAANLSALTWMVAKDDEKGQPTMIVASVPKGLERPAEEALFTLGKEDVGLFHVKEGIAIVDGFEAILRLVDAGVKGPVFDSASRQRGLTITENGRTRLMSPSEITRNAYRHTGRAPESQERG